MDIMQNQSIKEEIKMDSTETSPSKEKETTQIPTYSTSQLLSLPQELFMEICENLHPKDLYTLTLVCKQFRIILWSDSINTQQIWCNSRAKFLHSLMKLPNSLTEQKFIWLGYLGQTCQCCGQDLEDNNRRRFWEFKVMVCSKCADEKTISLAKLKGSHVSEKVISCLPCISETNFRNDFNFLVNATSPGYNGTNPYYWKSDVSRAIDEYNSLSEDKIEDWIKAKQDELEDFNQIIVNMRIKEDEKDINNLLCNILLSR
ncbi:10505_t:CDS:2 [Funneliformis geosporum]|uniref:5113_t:CDS:1 n=1 Tax=Funneliformis geosporum TaxID=1117311 RepID=A0A9W4SF73_9GLOM|nr:10505_t:CDS:2 [Funneliformis geosporum]CAI2167282.1 5113_t:CDS:2 [Funneliformis geosporum]